VRQLKVKANLISSAVFLALLQLMLGTDSKRGRGKLRFFYARPCDDPAPGWCVAEVEISPKGAHWSGSIYEPTLGRVRNKMWEKRGMTRQQAQVQAKRLMEAAARKAIKRPLRTKR